MQFATTYLIKKLIGIFSEFDEQEKLVFKPPPLHEVWLTDTEYRKLKEEFTRQRQSNWNREKDQVYQIPNLIPMKTEDHATTPPLVLVVSDDKSDDNSISYPQFSEGEPHIRYITPASPITPEPPHQK